MIYYFTDYSEAVEKIKIISKVIFKDFDNVNSISIGEEKGKFFLEVGSDVSQGQEEIDLGQYFSEKKSRVKAKHVRKKLVNDIESIEPPDSFSTNEEYCIYPDHLKIGMSVSSGKGSKGTIGAFVSRGEGRYLLSCDHVFRENYSKSVPVIKVCQPAVNDSCEVREVGVFRTLVDDKQTGCPEFDIALAQIESDDLELTNRTHISNSLITEVGLEPPPGRLVFKEGQATDQTFGKIVRTYAYLRNYSEHFFQIEPIDTDAFVENKDSGSAVIDKHNNELLGIIIQQYVVGADGKSHGLAISAYKIFNFFEIKLLNS